MVRLRESQAGGQRGQLPVIPQLRAPRSPIRSRPGLCPVQGEASTRPQSRLATQRVRDLGVGGGQLPHSPRPGGFPGPQRHPFLPQSSAAPYLPRFSRTNGFSQSSAAGTGRHLPGQAGAWVS